MIREDPARSLSADRSAVTTSTSPRNRSMEAITRRCSFPARSRVTVCKGRWPCRPIEATATLEDIPGEATPAEEGIPEADALAPRRLRPTGTRSATTDGEKVALGYCSGGHRPPAMSQVAGLSAVIDRRFYSTQALVSCKATRWPSRAAASQVPSGSEGAASGFVCSTDSISCSIVSPAKS